MVNDVLLFIHALHISTRSLIITTDITSLDRAGPASSKIICICDTIFWTKLHPTGRISAYDLTHMAVAYTIDVASHRQHRCNCKMYFHLKENH